MRKNALAITMVMYKPGLESQLKLTVDNGVTTIKPHTEGELTGDNMDSILRFQKLAKDEARALAARLTSALESVAADIENVDILIEMRG